MFNKIDMFFQKLTLENWGFPWHIVIAFLLFILVAPVMGLLVPDKYQAAGITWLIVNIVGYAYEVYQVKTGKMAGYCREFRQDMLANNIGSLSGVLSWILPLITTA
jgi:hypothetical protein